MFIWTLGDALYVAIGLLLLACWVIISAKGWFRQYRCKHDSSIGETQSCDAICRKCGKNLGFIGAWRDKQKKTLPNA